jgi:diguanylate cyclase (GGDEF)-like protein
LKPEASKLKAQSSKSSLGKKISLSKMAKRSMVVSTGFLSFRKGFPSRTNMQEISVPDQGQFAEVDILRAFLSASEAALVLVSPEGIVSYASQGAQDLYGNLVLPLVGRQIFELITKPSAELLKRHFADMVANGTPRLEVTLPLAEFTDSAASSILAGPISAALRVPPTRPFRPVSRIEDSANDGSESKTNNRTIRFEIINGHGNRALNGFVMIVREIADAPLSEQERVLRPKIEALLSKTLARFANASIGSTERDLHESLGEFCELAGIERAMLWVLDESGRMFVPENEVHQSGVLPLDGRTPNLPLMVVKTHAPTLFDGDWIVATRDSNFAPLLSAVEVPDLSAIPQITFAPLLCDGQLVGLLSLNATDFSTMWSEHTKTYIDSVTSIFGNALNRRDAERALAFQALHDSLTGLPNRSLLLDRLRIALARSARTTDNVCVMLIDLDGFKQVNDTLGHAAGDELLQVISRRLVDTMRDADSVARLGGDEFVIVAETATDEVNARIVADRVLDVLRQPVRVGDADLLVSGSVGLVIANASHDRTLDAGALLRKADIAMYRAKTGGRNRVEIYRDEMDRRVSFSS